MTPRVQAYIGLGANLGAAKATLEHAAQDLSRTAGISHLVLSKFYRSAPIDSSGPDYINAAARVQTSLPAATLLAAMQEIEQRYGRVRPYHNAPRTLDLDLLLYGDESIVTTNLVVPHPRMHQRAFVLKPLSDLNPGLRLPQGPISALLAACAGQKLEQLPD